MSFFYISSQFSFCIMVSSSSYRAQLYMGFPADALILCCPSLVISHLISTVPKGQHQRDKKHNSNHPICSSLAALMKDLMERELKP